MTGKRTLKLEGLRGLGIRLYLTWNGDHRLEILDFPDFGGVVCGAGCEVLDIRREEDAGDVVFVCREVSYWYQGGLFAVLHEVPDVDVTLDHVSSFDPRIGVCIPSWCLRRVSIRHLRR